MPTSSTGPRAAPTSEADDDAALSRRFPARLNRAVGSTMDRDPEHPIVELGCPPEKIRVHHLGIDLRRFAFVPRRWDRKSPLKVLLCATFTEKKGLPYALEALAKEESLAITLIGDADDSERQQEEKAAILAAIDRYEFGPLVTCTDYLKHAEILKAAYEHHVFVSPSVTARDGDTEGGAPVAVCEFAATGMPIVSTRHCDIRKVVEDGKGAVLAEERDAIGLLQNLARLVYEPALWESLVHTARKRIETHFDAVAQGRALAEIYEGVAAGGRSSRAAG